MDNLASTSLHAPFGWVRVSVCQGLLNAIDLFSRPERPEIEREGSDSYLDVIVRQMEAYFDNPSFAFDLRLANTGTPFQQRIWHLLRIIPLGQTLSYASLARLAGSGSRAVAAACRANPYPIVVPCHRVVAVHGLGGYCGQRDGPMLEIKRWLLRHEGGEPIGID